MRAIFLAAATVLLLVSPARADNPRKVAIGPGSAKGALLIHVPWTHIDQILSFARDGDPTSKTHWVAIEAKPVAKFQSVLVLTLPPGRYRLEAVYQQLKWVACLRANTLAVDVEPGKLAYLGTLDTRPTLASISRNAQANKDLRAHLGEWHFYRTNIAVPQVTGRDPAGLARAEDFVRQHMPKTSAPATLANLQWAPYQPATPSGRANQCD